MPDLATKSNGDLVAATVLAAVLLMVAGMNWLDPVSRPDGLMAWWRHRAYQKGGRELADKYNWFASRIASFVISPAPQHFAKRFFLYKIINDMVAEAIPTEILPFEKIKALYPDEWVLLGNPETDNTQIIIGMMHGKDKREIAYLGREIVKHYKTYSLRYTGEFPKNRKFWL